MHLNFLIVNMIEEIKIFFYLFEISLCCVFIQRGQFKTKSWSYTPWFIKYNGCYASPNSCYARFPHIKSNICFNLLVISLSLSLSIYISRYYVCLNHPQKIYQIRILIVAFDSLFFFFAFCFFLFALIGVDPQPIIQQIIESSVEIERTGRTKQITKRVDFDLVCILWCWSSFFVWEIKNKKCHGYYFSIKCQLKYWLYLWKHRLQMWSLMLGMKAKFGYEGIFMKFSKCWMKMVMKFCHSSKQRLLFFIIK